MIVYIMGGYVRKCMLFCCVPIHGFVCVCTPFSVSKKMHMCTDDGLCRYSPVAYVVILLRQLLVNTDHNYLIMDY